MKIAMFFINVLIIIYIKHVNYIYKGKPLTEYKNYFQTIYIAPYFIMFNLILYRIIM